MSTLPREAGPFFESLRLRTLLGIRFWDFVTDRPVQDGLRVTAAVRGSRARPRPAFRTLGGVYGFDHLPDLQDAETWDEPAGAGPSSPPTSSPPAASSPPTSSPPAASSPPTSSPPAASSPPSTTTYWIEVWDGAARFLPVGFELEVPPSGLGLYAGDPTHGSPGTTGRGVYLFSAPTRPVAMPIAAIRGQLYDVDRDAWAAHGLIEVTLPEPTPPSPPTSPPRPRTRFGIADREGRFLVAFVYPEFDLGAIHSPPSPPTGAVFSPRAQRWDLRVAVRYDRLAAPGAAPDLRAILGQSPARVWPTPVSAAAEVTPTLSFDRELVVSTDTEPTLWVRSSSSP